MNREIPCVPRAALALLILAACLGLANCPAQAQVSESAVSAAKENLRGALGESTRSAEVLRGLRATGDKDLLPLFYAMCNSSDRMRRLFGVLAVCDLAPSDAVETMHQRYRQEADGGIRGVALNHLIQNHAASDEEIKTALESKDDNVALMGAREAMKRGYSPQALDVLKRIVADSESGSAAADKKDDNSLDWPELAILSRMLLLSANQFEQAEPLNKMLSDENAEPRLKLLLLGLIAKDNIQSAQPMVKKIIESRDLPEVRMEAIRTLSILSGEEGTQAILAELDKTTDTVAQVQLIMLLGGLKGADKPLYHLCEINKPLLSELARFELARLAENNEELQTSTQELLKTGHPIVADLVMRKAKEKPNEAYVPGLLQYIRSVPNGEPGPEHASAASATVVLVKISSPAAEKGLAEIASGPYSGVTRSVASGLAIAEGPCLGNVAEKLLASPYDEISTAGALALGKIGDPRATKILTDIVTHHDRYPASLVAMASWDLLKVAGQHTQFIKELAKKDR